MAYKKTSDSLDHLLNENKELRSRLAKTEETLNALLSGENGLGLQTLKSGGKESKTNKSKGKKSLSRSADPEIESRIHSVYDSMSDGLAVHEIIYDNEGTAVDYIITDVNPAFEKITRLKKAVISGKKATEAYKLDEPPYLDIYAEVASTGVPSDFETYFPPMSKHFHISVFSPGKGKFATVFQDITERKRTEEELHVTLRRFYLMLSSLKNGILLATNDGSVEFVNQPYCDLFGLKESPTELLNLSADELIAKTRNSFKDPETALSRINEIIINDKPLSGEDIKMSSGRTLLRDFMPINVRGEKLGHLWNFRDNTERNLIYETQNFLLNSGISGSGEDFFESLAKFLSKILVMDYVCIDKLEGDNLTATTVAIFNDGKFDHNISYALKETPCGDVVGNTICCFPKNVCSLFPNDRALQELNAESYIGTTLWSFHGKPIGLIAAIGKKPLKDQHLAEVVLKLVAIRAAGELERKQAEAQLRESEERFRSILNNSQDLIYRLNLQTGSFEYLSESAGKVLGYPYDDIITMDIRSVMELVHPDDRSVFKEYSSRLAETGKKNIEYRQRSKNGDYRWLSNNGSVIKDLNGKPLFNDASIRDITEQKEAQIILTNTLERLRIALEAVELGTWDLDLTTGKAIHSLRHDQIFGYKELLPEWTFEMACQHMLPEYEPLFREAFVTAEKTGVLNFEGKIVWPDGSIHWISPHGIVRYNSEGQPIHAIGVVADITERKKAEEELKRSEQLYRAIGESIDYGVWVCDANGKNTYASESYLKLVGMTQEQCSDFGWGDTLHPDDAEKTLAAWKECARTGNKWDIEHRFRGVDGQWHPILARGIPIRDDKGNIISWAGINLNISKIKQTEKALKESERILKSVLNATKESIYMFDREGIITMSNTKGIERLKRNSETEVVGHHFSEFMPEEIARGRQKKLDAVYKTGKPLEFEDKRGNKIFHHNFFPVFQDEKVLYVVTYSSDITDHKESELKLHESEHRFRTITESITVMIAISRISDATITFLNEPTEKYFGYKKEDLTGKRIPDIFYYPDDRTSLNDLLKIKGVFDNLEIRVKKSDGTPFWILTSVRKINFLGEPSYLMVSIDITDTKNTQEELLRLNRTLNAHSKSSQIMMQSGNEFDYLDKVCRIIIEDCGYKMVWIGYAEDDSDKSVIPVAYYGFDQGYINEMKISWDESERGSGPTGMAIRTGKPSICRNMLTDPAFQPWKKAAIKRGYYSSLVLPLISDGKTFGAVSIYSKEPDSFTESEIRLLSDLADDLAYGVSFIRLSESERSATKIIKESEAKLKELVATKDKFFNIVAHDLKNPFTSLLGSSELLYNNLSQMDSETIKKLALILYESAKGGYAILQNLLDWSRSQTGLLKISPEKINLKNLLRENILNFELHATNKDIDLDYGTVEDLFIVVDKNMLNTVVRNLLSNAVKFTHKNGKVTISYELTSNEVTISVKDTGIGIPAEKIDNLFRIDNRYSNPGTANEQGTGLGLKLSKEFVEKLGGKIWVESIENKGSEFKFSIPVTYVVKP